MAYPIHQHHQHLAWHTNGTCPVAAVTELAARGPNDQGGTLRA